jgi:putative transposase
MYEYRQADPKGRLAMIVERQAHCWPWHAPPHFNDEENVYLLTAACFEHNPIMGHENRRHEMMMALIELIESINGDLRAWVVLPNHYHLLARLKLDAFAKRVGRLHNGKATQWNREDGFLGRKVWHRFADRRIRGDRHYFATLNYIHRNPVHHGWANDLGSWACSSFEHFVKTVGQETVDLWQREYAIEKYGEGWDDV